jgi:hypothetical protein
MAEATSLVSEDTTNETQVKRGTVKIRITDMELVELVELVEIDLSSKLRIEAEETAEVADKTWAECRDWEGYYQ